MAYFPSGNILTGSEKPPLPSVPGFGCVYIVTSGFPVNAGMVAMTAYFQYLKKDFASLDFEPKARWPMV